MKQIFSTKWKASRQPRKKRKYIWNAPIHVRRKLMAATLSDELRAKYSLRNIEVRKNDEVEIMRGKFKKKRGKIIAINMDKMKVAIDGIQFSKKDGTKINAWLHPSNLRIVTLDTNDKMRIRAKSTKENKEIKEKK